MGNKFHPQCFVCTYCRKVSKLWFYLWYFHSMQCLYSFCKTSLILSARSSKTVSTRRTRGTSSRTALTASRSYLATTATLTTAKNKTQKPLKNAVVNNLPQKELTPNKWTRYILFQVIEATLFSLTKNCLCGFESTVKAKSLPPNPSEAQAIAASNFPAEFREF